jgi:hypothetical protein
MSNELVLENETLIAKFDRSTGALSSFESKKTNWQVTRRPELGLSFRMLVPLEGRRNNPVLGEKQSPPVVEVGADGSLAFTWNKVRSEFGGSTSGSPPSGEHEITFTGTVKLTEDGLTFGGQVANRTNLVIESVSWPCLGDVTAPKPENSLERWTWGYSGADKTSLFPKFHNHKGYYGVDHPINFASTTTNMFVLAHGGKQGLYAGCHDNSGRAMVAWCFELKPGFSSCEDVNLGKVPPVDEISGHKVHVEFSAIHFPYFNPGESGSLQAVVLQPYVGSWHKGVDCYRKWRSTWAVRPKGAAWVHDVHSWLQIHINSPEDELRCQYKDLVKYGEDCAKHGVKAIQLVGWNNGGQDRGNPSHDVDPRLGTWQELKDAIAKIEAMGVRMIMFNKYVWADQSLPWFKEELVKYAVKNPYGDYTVYPGYQYQTATQLMDLNTRRLIPMCHNSKAWREIACKEFKKSIDLGASGMLFDESQHHGGGNYCFDPSHGHHVPANNFGQGDEALEKDLHKVADEHNPDYMFAGEANYDLQYRHYHLAYTRLNAPGHIAYHRYVDPTMELMMAVTGFDDHHTINRCLMHRYIISYEPFNFKGRLGDFPLTLEYGKKVDALRRRYREFVWDGEYRDTQGATVTIGTGKNAKDHAGYSVFVAKSGKSAVVVANLSDDKELQAKVRLDRARPKWVSVTPENPEPQECSGTVTIPPASVVVLMQT